MLWSRLILMEVLKFLRLQHEAELLNLLKWVIQRTMKASQWSHKEQKTGQHQVRLKLWIYPILITCPI